MSLGGFSDSELPEFPQLARPTPPPETHPSD
jgi:hypothetical protein